MNSIFGIGCIKRNGLESYLKVHMKKMGVHLGDCAWGRAEGAPRASFIIIDDLTFPLIDKTVLNKIPLKYAILYKSNLKIKLSLLNQGFSGVFKFPVLIEEIVKLIQNHLGLYDKTESRTNLHSKLYPNGIEIIKTSHKNLYVLRYKNKVTTLSKKETLTLNSLLQTNILHNDSINYFFVREYQKTFSTSTIFSLRKKLTFLRVPLEIKNMYGYGYYLVPKYNNNP